MNKFSILKSAFLTLILATFSAVPSWGQTTSNPLIWADVPDPSIIRVNDTYYMVSTTMHMNPGLPIMKSANLVDWTIVNYAYDVLANNDAMNLERNADAYGKGSWASSINYKDGTFYIHTFSYTTNRSHIYTTTDIENGSFTEHTLSQLSHDASLFIDDDGKAYLAYGHDEIYLRELNSDFTDYQSGGIHQPVIASASSVAGSDFILTAEGTQMFKINGWYYIMNICWPSGSGRTVVIHRSRNLTGPYEGQVALNDKGVAQGGLICTPSGEWYSYLFRDFGAVGRIPYLVPINWQNDWPVFGVNGQVPDQINIPRERNDLQGIVSSDDFGALRNTRNGLKLEWQWNHNPVNSHWSLTERPGFLRITNDRIDPDFVTTRNTLTQRTFGPECRAIIAMEVSGMMNGDYAGLGALQYDYGFVGVKMNGGSKSIVMVNGSDNFPSEIASVPLNQDRVYLQIQMDYNNRADRATFHYSLDGSNWQSIGNTLQMSYKLEHFMGYRFALFNFGTQSTGGYVDFDHYIVNDYPFDTPDRTTVYDIPSIVQAENYSTMSGIQTEPDANGEYNIGWINDGDWTKYLINVPEEGYYTIRIVLASAVDGNNEIIVKDAAGSSLESLSINNSQTSDWHDWYTDSLVVHLPAGEQELQFLYSGDTDYLFNINSFEFVAGSLQIPTHIAPPSPQNHLQSIISFGGSTVQISVGGISGNLYTLDLYNLNGKKIAGKIVTGNSQVDLEVPRSAGKGVYFIKLTGYSNPGHL
jgi:beta-xylosidase